MEITPEHAADILSQIQNNQWKWVKVKRFVPENFPNTETRYAALEKHHEEETGRMIEIIQGLCRLVVAQNKTVILQRIDGPPATNSKLPATE